MSSDSAGSFFPRELAEQPRAIRESLAAIQEQADSSNARWAMSLLEALEQRAAA